MGARGGLEEHDFVYWYMFYHIHHLHGEEFPVLSLLRPHALRDHRKALPKPLLHLLHALLHDIVQSLQMVAERLEGQVPIGCHIDDEPPRIQPPDLPPQSEPVHFLPFQLHVQEVDPPPRILFHCLQNLSRTAAAKGDFHVIPLYHDLFFQTFPLDPADFLLVLANVY